MQNTKKSDSPYGTDYLTGSGVEELRPISPGEYDQSRYGACCPVCEGEYA
jgi:hypothetical protein